MPCRYDGPPEPDLRPELDEVTRLLCKLCGRIEKAYGEGDATELLMGREITKWWKAHKLMDKARRLREFEADRAEKLEAYEKLKKELGL